MVKHKVQINNANGQPFVNLSKSDNWNKGQLVEIKEYKGISQEQLDAWVKANSSSIELADSKLNENRANYMLSPIYTFKEYFKKTFGVDDMGEEVYDAKINDAIIYSEIPGEVEDSDDYIDYDNLEENIEVFTEANYGFCLDETKVSKQKMLDSALLFAYTKIQKQVEKDYNDSMNDVMSELGFEFYDWGGNMAEQSEFRDVYKHRELDIYASVSRMLAEDDIEFTNLE